MLETFKFSREDAVREGYRSSVEISKEYFKRPLLKIYRKKHYSSNLNAVNNIYKEIPCRLSYAVNVYEYFKGDIEKKKEYNMINKTGMAMLLKDLAATNSFKNKTIYVYIEKQHNGIYALRELRGKDNYITDIDFDKFYNIVGKIAFINLNKSKGEYKINRILKLFD